MTERHPCSPYLLKPLRSLEDAQRELGARRSLMAAARKAQGRSSAPATPPREVEMKPKELQAAQRKQAWDTTKQAVGAYARNPCAATEIHVAAALKEVKRLCRPGARAAGKPGQLNRAG